MFDSIFKKGIGFGIAMLFMGFASVSALANEQFSEQDEPESIRLFMATGEHKCWSNTSIGHTCMNHGASFTSCDDAYWSLKAQDCCGATKEKGTSVEFKVTKCSQF